MSGKNFCSAAMDAFGLIVRNPLRFAVTAGVGDFFCVLGKVFICCFTTVTGYFLITKVEYYEVRIADPTIPTIVFS